MRVKKSYAILKKTKREVKAVRFQVTKEEDGMLLRSVIFHRLHPSTKLLRSLKFRPDGILVNGAHATVRRVLHEGDEVTLATEDGASPSYLLPVDLPLSILYEDEALVVPSKPADMSEIDEIFSIFQR